MERALLASSPMSGKVLELMRHGLKVHDIASLLGVHPRVVMEVRR
jgi:hypothetical protein